jgi:hypothetical protein
MASYAKFWMAVTAAGLLSMGAVRAETVKKAAKVALQGQTSCPIAMVAQQEAGLLSQKEVEAQRKAHATGPAHQIHFKFTNEKLGAIAAIQLRVNGWDGVARDVPLIKTDARKTNTWKLVDVKVNIGPRKSAETDVWVRGLTSLNSIDLMSVHYADGSNWKASNTSACSVVPDPTMLISQR